MLEVLRLTTVHPTLVHFTIGTVPVLVLLYVVAAVRPHEDRWAFAGDVVLAATAVLTIATLAFGLVSNAVLEWPGGLSTWRWLHLGLGISSATLLAAFAAARLRLRHRGEPAVGRITVAAAAVAAGVIGATGWVGGEVLVYHSGMAVAAAGEGALAPATSAKPPRPSDLHEAMHAARASWASARTALAEIVVHEPDPSSFDRIAREASHLERVGGWVEENGGSALAEHGHGSASERDALAQMARRLTDASKHLERTAHARDVVGATAALGEVMSTCAACPVRLRWDHAEGEPSAEAEPAKGRRPAHGGVERSDVQRRR